RRGRPVLDEGQVLQLARAVKLVERALGQPVDVEWVFDGRMFWAVQARPITALVAASRATPRRPRLWTRANLKEVFPELPSPLALSYLAISLNRMFRSYHAANGYSLPDGANLVSVIHGRPYLNLSLMQDLAIERGGNPAIGGRLGAVAGLHGAGGAADGLDPDRCRHRHEAPDDRPRDPAQRPDDLPSHGARRAGGAGSPGVRLFHG